MVNQIKESSTQLDDLTFYSMLGVLQSGMWLLNDIEIFLRPFGISHGRFSILLAIMEAGDEAVQPVVLARMLGKSKPAITNMIERLKTDGLIVTKDNHQDRRSFNLKLTAEGKELLQSIIPAYNQRVARMSAGLTEQDKHHLLELLGKIRFQDSKKKLITGEQ